MKYLKSNAAGVDAEINTYIDRISNVLSAKGISLEYYHRVYKELTDQGETAPYAFLSDKDYVEIFLDDTVSGAVGFLVSENRVVSKGMISVDCDIIFSVNLDTIDNGSLQREDEKFMMIALAAVQKYGDVKAIKTGLTNVFSDFDTERIKFRDMQPFFNFSFTININFKNNNCYVL